MSQLKLLMSIAGGGTVSGGQTCGTAQTCQLSLQSTVGITQFRVEIYSYPVGFAVPAGWTDDTTGAVTGIVHAYYYATNTTIPVFTPNIWGKYLYRCFAQGNTTGGADPLLTDDLCGTKSLSPRLGLDDLAVLEDGRFGGYPKAEQSNLRAMENGFAGLRGRILFVAGELQTTDATVTTVAAFTMSDETLCAFDVVVTAAMRTDLDKGGRWKRSVVYRRTDAGAPTIVGALESGTDEETDAATDVTIDVSGNDVRVRVTGIAATNFNWLAELRVQETTAA